MIAKPKKPERLIKDIIYIYLSQFSTLKELLDSIPKDISTDQIRITWVSFGGTETIQCLEYDYFTENKSFNDDMKKYERDLERYKKRLKKEKEKQIKSLQKEIEELSKE